MKVSGFLFIFLMYCFSATVFCQSYTEGFPLTKSVNGYYTIANVPDGNYFVRVKIGDSKHAGSTSIRGESRRSFFESIETRKGQFVEVTFTINKRDSKINDTTFVKIKDREKNKFNWDNDLTFEFVGSNPQVAEIEVTPVNHVTTIFLCGNSTVVDQDNEPWASWGQMIPRFFNNQVCFANYAESGESAYSFIAARRFEKVFSLLKLNDYVFIEFGHNDQKQTGVGKGPYLNFYQELHTMVKKAREKGAFPVLVTPTQRRSFNNEGKIMDTHGEYPDAMKLLAREENVPLLDLHQFTRILYEALGVENSIHAFVHYAANTFPNQPRALEDNTHFNPYGAYEIAKCVIEGMKQLQLPLIQYLRSDYLPFDPSHPDDFNKFQWFPSGFSEIVKPDGC